MEKIHRNTSSGMENTSPQFALCMKQQYRKNIMGPDGPEIHHVFGFPKLVGRVVP
jgi:hypothetical protein